MSERDDAALPSRVEALLTDWPLPEPSDAAWDALTAGVLARLPNATRDDGVLGPPLPPEPGEPGGEQLRVVAERASRERPAGEPSLAAMARAAIAPDGRERDLAVAKDSLQHVARARSRGEVADSVARAAETTHAEPARGSRAVTPDREWGRPALAAMVTLLAAAAAFFLYLRAQSEGSAPSSVATEPTASMATTRPLVSVEHDIAHLDDLPSEAHPSPLAWGSTPRVGPGKAGAAAPPSAPAASLAKAPDEFDQKLPIASARSMPVAPSTGEAVAALAPSVGRAKLCVVGHTAPSQATITFGSDGRVTSVVVTGPAAGTPAAGCIENAFRSARVAAFAKPSFTVTYPVRP